MKLMEQEKSLILERLTDSYMFSDISIISFIINLILSIILSVLIAYTYTKFGKNISNRKEFADNFTLLTITTMFIITIVKSSLALSLGLVGALSIVRFRSAIKDPEELTYLFFSIGIGLGLGANQIKITIIATLLTIFYLIVKSKLNNKIKNQFINIIINCPKDKNYNFEDILKTLSEKCKNLNLKRYVEDDDYHELFIDLNIDSFDETQLLINKLSKNFPGIKIDLIDPTGIE